MKKLFILFIALISLVTNAQVLPLNKDRRNIGLATQLRGDVNVLSIYVDDGSSFSPKMKDDYADELMKAENWLLNEATVHGIKLGFNNFYCGVDKSVMYNPTHGWVQTEPRDVIISAFGSEVNARSWFSKHPNCAVIIFVPNKGNLYCSAVSISKNYTGKLEYLEGAKIYPYEMEEKYLEIIHEMLHLFGAWDLYDGPVKHKVSMDCDYQTWYNRLSSLRYSKERKCKSIMFDVSAKDAYGKSVNHYIDELTAHLIGWDEDWQDWYAYYTN